MPRPSRTVRTPESPAHSCSAANAGRQPGGRRARRRGRSARARRSSGCGSDSTRRSRRWVTRPESGSSALVSRRSSVDLPAPLRPTTPTRSASSSPSETSVSSVPAAPYALETRSRLTMLAIRRHPSGRRRTRHRVRRAPGRRRPRARHDRRVGRDGHAAACAASRARKTQVGPEPETMRGERAGVRAGVQGLGELRPQRQRGRLQVVAERGGEHLRVALAQRGHQLVRRAQRRRARAVRRAAGRARGRRPAWTGRRRRSRPPSATWSAGRAPG